MYLFCISLFFFFLHTSYSDWASEWLNPVQLEYKSIPNDYLKVWNEDKDLQILPRVKNLPENMRIEEVALKSEKPPNFPMIVETTIAKAKRIIDSLKKEISSELEQELLLKDAIANGRLGVTIATVTMIGRSPRSYMVRNESWTLCKGNVLYPYNNQAPSKWRTELPKCSGQEITTNRDPCIFNSIIKYNTIPTTRRSVYREDDYLCQKSSFNNSFENYKSVSPSIIKQTCQNDISKSLSEYQLECGPRIIIEYTLYPYSWYLNTLPTGYCDSDGTCKLTVAWHLTNLSIENFEHFDFDETFKQYFINSQLNTDF